MLWKLLPRLKFLSTHPTSMGTLGLWHWLPGHWSWLAKKNKCSINTLLYITYCICLINDTYLTDKPMEKQYYFRLKVTNYRFGFGEYKVSPWTCNRIFYFQWEKRLSIIPTVVSLPGAYPGIFVKGGPTCWKFLTSKKKNRQKGEREGGFSSYSASVW